MDINVRSRPSEGTYVVDVAGEIDVYTVPTLKDALKRLTDDQHYELVIDLLKVDYIDSTGLSALVDVQKLAREHDGAVTVVLTDPHIKKTFDIMGLDKIFWIFEDEQSAVKQLRRPAHVPNAVNA
ncbi:MAG: STAS domain-containing protein [Candidatus Lustribacter sp.]|jgi:anti-sigma B factor antagonist